MHKEITFPAVFESAFGQQNAGQNLDEIVSILTDLVFLNGREQSVLKQVLTIRAEGINQRKINTELRKVIEGFKKLHGAIESQ